MFEKVDHIGIAVRDLEKMVRIFRDSLGLEYNGEEEVPEQKVRTAFFPAGESKIELLQTTDPDGPIGRFIAKKGEGVHHIALGVSDIEAKIRELKEKGIEMIDEKPRYGAGGAKIAFIHPQSTGGVLIELCQH
ncbi:MAG: methylmalonyl-CoA epimerase [Firmicutes bacterium ML8_F2]|nr:MAG: methylmalonyl-CoA epimerase [Firmicutes bacterium ML8_F2]